MSSLNSKIKAIPLTHEGAPAKRITPLQKLRRSVLACFLWEDQFYESGQSIAERILGLCEQVSKDDIASLAIEAREAFKLRHVPLLLLCGLVKKGGQGVADTIARVIQRADEMAELMAIYQQLGNKKIAKQLQRGLAMAFNKFDAYQLAKYNRDGAWKLRDVLFISHARPANEERDKLWKSLIDGSLPIPDTWEVALSGGADKKETFTRLIKEDKLGYLALLRNLRNMEQAGVDRSLVQEALSKGDASRVLPFRFVAAARHAPQYEPVLDKKMIESCKVNNHLDGTTIVLVDVSGSMNSPVSAKSDLTRMDAAATLASMIVGDVRVITFSERNVEVPHRLGMAGVETIKRSQRHSGTNLSEAVAYANTLKHDRLIVISDEQAATAVPNPVIDKAYMINVASYQNGIGYGKGWVNISGFSESVLRYINEVEK